MDAGIQERKAVLRAGIREQLRRWPASERALASEAACERLRRQPEWQASRHVLFFAPLSDELNLWPLVLESLKIGRRVALPRRQEGPACYEAAAVFEPERDLVTGAYGVLEPGRACPPVPLNQLDLVLVPGLGFDLTGRRLGRGLGFYDRLLPGFTGWRCGVATDGQVVPDVPVDTHDCRVDFIVTPTRWIACRRRAV